MKSKKIRRYFCYSESDETIIAWLKAQQSLSISLCVLIKNYVVKYGATDIMTQTLCLADETALPKENDTFSRAKNENSVSEEKAEEKTEETTVAAEQGSTNEEVQINNVDNNDISPANRGKTSQQINDELLAQLLK